MQEVPAAAEELQSKIDELQSQIEERVLTIERLLTDIELQLFDFNRRIAQIEAVRLRKIAEDAAYRVALSIIVPPVIAGLLTYVVVRIIL